MLVNAAAADRLTAEERREAILLAALPIFAAKGFDAVTTREVAEAAGVSEALLYRHFSSKKVMYEAIQDVCVLRATADAQRIEMLPDSTSTLVLSIYAIMRGIQLAPPGDDDGMSMPRLVMRSLLTDGAFARSMMAASETRWRPKLERCIQAGIDAGDIRSELVPACLGVFFAHHIGASVMYYRLPAGGTMSYPGGNDAEWILDQSVRFALRGLGLTEQAIVTHYNPNAFSMLVAAR
jgi:AcrR family transcriptional regulator